MFYLILLSLIPIYFLFRFIFVNGNKASINTDVKDKTIIITGSSDGIGKETAKVLSKLGAHIILACRSASKTQKVIEEIKNEAKDAKLTFIELDLSDFDSIKKFVDKFHNKNLPLDMIINNAATIVYNDQEYYTKQGYEMMFGVNYLGPFLLTKLLIPDLIQSKGQIVTVASGAHQELFFETKETFNFLDKTKINFKGKGLWSILLQYGFSKLLNVLHSKQIHRLYNKQGIKSNCLHPGAIATNISHIAPMWASIPLNFLMWLIFKTPLQGAQTTIHVATKKDMISGEYYDNCSISKASDLGNDEKKAQELWDWTEKELEPYLK